MGRGREGCRELADGGGQERSVYFSGFTLLWEYRLLFSIHWEDGGLHFGL